MCCGSLCCARVGGCAYVVCAAHHPAHPHRPFHRHPRQSSAPRTKFLGNSVEVYPISACLALVAAWLLLFQCSYGQLLEGDGCRGAGS